MDRRELLKSGAVAAAAITVGITPGIGSAAPAKRTTPYLPDVPEVTHLLERWDKTGLLKGLSEQGQINCVQAMENQRVWNEHQPDDELAKFKRISIPIIRRLFGFFDQEGINVRSRCQFNDPKLKLIDAECPWKENPLDVFKNMYQQYSLDKEAERTAVFTERLAEEIKVMTNWDADKTLYLYCLGFCEDVPYIQHPRRVPVMFYEFE